MKQIFLLCLLIGLALPGLMAQESLEVYKPDSERHYYFQTGDTLCVQLQKQPELLCGIWAYIDRETIFINGTLVKLDSIEWVDVSQKIEPRDKWNLPANFLIAAGVGYVALDQVNSLLFDQEPRVDLGVVRSGAYLVAGGFLIKLVALMTKPSGKARIGKKYKISVTDYSS